MSNEVKELFFEVAERGGWLQQDRLEVAKTIAKRFLLMGDSIEKVAEATGLPYETVSSLV